MLKKIEDAIVFELSYAKFFKAIRAACRGLWSGVLTLEEFYDMMLLAVEQGLEAAWSDGANEVGIDPDERTSEEQIALDLLVFQSTTRIWTFGEWILQHNKESGGKLSTVFNRAEMWINRYNEARNLAKVMAGADRKLKWTLGPTEHCDDCAKLAGKVKRASSWKKADIRPRMRKLKCGGFRCQCELKPTRAKLTRGRLPKIG